MVNDQDSGTPGSTSFAWWDHDSSSSKTWQRSLDGGYSPFSGSLPTAGTMRSGRCYRLPTWAHLTSASACSSSRGSGRLLPTPNTRDHHAQGANHNPKAHSTSLATLIQKGRPGGQRSATATATANQLSPSMQKHPGCREISENWPTPTKSDGMGGPGNSGRQGGDNLRTAVDRKNRYPTPTTRDHKDTGDCANVPVNCLLGRAVGPSKAKGSLSVDFVTWLMGFPAGWVNTRPPSPPGNPTA